MNNSKLVYGIGLIALSLAVFFLATRAKDRLHIRFGDTHWGPPNSKPLDSFSITGVKQLNANGSCDIELIPDDNERVVFYYDKEEVENESTVKDSSLNIDFKNDGGRLFRRKSERIVVKIYTRNINHIVQEGVGSISSASPLVHDQIKLSNDGVGSMEFILQARNIEVSNGGVGSIDLKGNAEDALITNEGTGSIEADKLMLKRAKVSNQGIGSITVHASETLDMTNQGIGSIDYYGEAKVTNSQSQGVGSINKN
ncbi:MAG: DUF2807 domain-containing protein [Chitinophagaceae bacterium]|jgi:hypothetical protein